jgi:hypothetical protein
MISKKAKSLFASIAALGIVGAMLFLAGCSSTTQGSVKKPSAYFGKTSKAESAPKQPRADNFPTAQQAGL